MRQIAIALTALAFLAVPAAAEKCDDYGTCRAKRNGSTLLQTAPPVDQPADQPADLSSYRIGAFDVLELLVFQAPELTQRVLVGPTGQISLPLIGAVQAGGKTASEVEAEVASRLKVKYLKDPQVNIYIKEFNSQGVTAKYDVNRIKSGRAPDPIIQSGDVISVGESGLRRLVPPIPPWPYGRPGDWGYY